MDEFTYLVAGVPDTPARELTRGRAFAGGVTVRRSTLDLPGRHGTTPGAGPVVYEDGKLTLTWELQASTWAGVEAERLALMALLGGPGDLIVTRRVGSVDLTAAHRLVSVTDVESESGMPLVTVKVVLSAPGVFWRAPVVTSAPIAAGPSVVTAEVGSLAGCTAPIADAVLRITGPAVSVTVTDAATSTGLTWDGTLFGGRFLFMDAHQLRAWISADAEAWEPTGTDATSGLDYPTAGPLQLWPEMVGVDPTARRVTVNVEADGGDAGTALVVRAQPAYL